MRRKAQEVYALRCWFSILLVAAPTFWSQYPAQAAARAYVRQAASPGPGLVSQAGSEPVAGAVLDLNTASAAELRTLPGMGSVYVRRVIEGRPYSAKNQLVTRGVLPKEAYERIRDRVVAHRLPKS